MDKFTTLEGVAAPLKMINVDTDMIIPKQYLKTIKRTGLGKGLFAEKRYRDDGSENPDFVLNKPAYRKARILVADDNFGCGSSREHAPWALMDFGIRCVISTSCSQSRSSRRIWRSFSTMPSAAPMRRSRSTWRSRRSGAPTAAW
jgi:3-isopropylmalate/(R)-2-methylmalate dehydratase small subunit